MDDAHTNVTCTDLSLTAIRPTDFPSIRIQVTLVASGSDRPTLHGWTLYFVGHDEWRDDFIGTGKVVDTRQVVVEGGEAHLDLPNLTRPSEEPDYEPFPTVYITRGSGAGAFLEYVPTDDRTGYRAVQQWPSNGTNDMSFDDLDLDGNLDMVLANRNFAGKSQPIEIRWGRGTDPFTYSNVTFHTYKGTSMVMTGDYNGDGEKDIAIPWNIFLNRGRGVFNSSPDVGWILIDEVGDVNNDGYDDIISSFTSGVEIHLGGPNGPDAWEYIELPADQISGGAIHVNELSDINLDGYLDLVIPQSSYDNIIYLGGPDGPDDVVDYNLSYHQDACTGALSGDLNNDGYIDLVFRASGGGGGTALIYFGSEDGWPVFPDTEFDGPVPYKLFDVNKDGYDDMLCFDGSIQRFLVFFGSDSWDWVPDVNKAAGVNSIVDMNLGFSDSMRSHVYTGDIMSEVISLPANRSWDLLTYEADAPPGTEVFVTVVDADNAAIRGLMMRPERTVDLIDLDDVTNLRVKFTYRTTSKSATPRVKSVMVKWMEDMTWRDEFYSDFRAERMLNLAVQDGRLTSVIPDNGPQVLVTSLKRDGDIIGYTAPTLAFQDSGGMDYTTAPPVVFNASGVEGASVADVDGDGYLDLALAVSARGDFDFETNSPLYTGSCVGFNELPAHIFRTVGARDVLLEDLNGDGRMDVVFAQERNGTDYTVDSVLFWGSKRGWNSTPDVEFSTRGASGVAAADFNRDGRLDLVFACYRDSSTTTDSMVFLQSAAGFCGTVPNNRLRTNGARAVAAEDLNGDGLVDLVFANSELDGDPRTESYIYWGSSTVGFQSTPKHLPTVGAEDVKVADLDGDGMPDIVFANRIDDRGDYGVDSYVYLNTGGSGFQDSPTVRLPTMGASAVEVADLDGTGRLDLLFACQYNGTNYTVPSVAYLGGSSGWSSTPDLEIETEGASDIVVANLLRQGHGGYMSYPIEPGDPEAMGSFHTFRYTASFGAGQGGRVHIVDAGTWEHLASHTLASGENEWVLAGAFRIKDHPIVKVVFDIEDPGRSGGAAVDEAWLNWTWRTKQAPRVMGMEMSPSSVMRMDGATLTVEVMDELDDAEDLELVVQHRYNGSAEWDTGMFGPLSFIDGAWSVGLQTDELTLTGTYDFRAQVTDLEDMSSDWFEAYSLLEVKNHIPTAPEVEILPAAPMSVEDLTVNVIRSATDIDGRRLSYRFRWSRDGVLVEDLVSNTVPAERTAKGENWSVEVRAFDGEAEGPPDHAWVIVLNSPLVAGDPLEDVVFDEDTVDTSIDLSKAAVDPDGDVLTWTIECDSDHLTVALDGATGIVTLTPRADWYGEAVLTLGVSEGEYDLHFVVGVRVRPVNDLPRFVTVNGQPAVGAVEVTVLQDEVLVVDVVAEDVEGDELTFEVNRTLGYFNPSTGAMSWTPTNEDVGTYDLRLSVHDSESPESIITLDLTVVVVNVNDLPSDPRITSVLMGQVIKVNQTLRLVGHCSDPDEVHGQVLTYSWSSNISGPLGVGEDINVTVSTPGVHRIMLKVSDGEFDITTFIDVTVEASSVPPPPNGDDGDGKKKDDGPGFGALVALTGISAAAALWRRNRKR